MMSYRSILGTILAAGLTITSALGFGGCKSDSIDDKAGLERLVEKSELEVGMPEFNFDARVTVFNTRNSFAYSRDGVHYVVSEATFSANALDLPDDIDEDVDPISTPGIACLTLYEDDFAFSLPINEEGDYSVDINCQQNQVNPSRARVLHYTHRSGSIQKHATVTLERPAGETHTYQFEEVDLDGNKARSEEVVVTFVTQKEYDGLKDYETEAPIFEKCEYRIGDMTYDTLVPVAQTQQTLDYIKDRRRVDGQEEQIALYVTDNSGLEYVKVSLDGEVVFDSLQEDNFRTGEKEYAAVFRSTDVPVDAGVYVVEATDVNGNTTSQVIDLETTLDVVDN